MKYSLFEICITITSLLVILLISQISTSALFEIIIAAAVFWPSRTKIKKEVEVTQDIVPIDISRPGIKNRLQPDLSRIQNMIQTDFEEDRKK